MDLLNRAPCAPACQRGLRANVPEYDTVPACQRAKSVSTSHFYVPTYHTSCQCFNLACQRAKRCVNFSTSCDKVPKGVQIFQIFFLRNTKRNFYTLLLYKKFCIILDIIVIHIICISIGHENCIKLHFYTSYHIKDFYLFIY